MTIHGDFSKIKNLYVNGYKYLMLNKNGSLGVKYNAIDGAKKATIKRALRFAAVREWYVTENSTDYYLFLPNRYVKSEQERQKVITELRAIRDSIPTTFIGRSGIMEQIIFDQRSLYIYIDLNAIPQVHLWSFISFLTKGAVQSEKQLEKLIKDENDVTEKERQERARMNAIATRLRDEYLDRLGIRRFPKLTSIPKGKFMMGFVKVSVSQQEGNKSEVYTETFRVYIAELNRFRKLKGRFKDYREIAELDLTEIEKEPEIDVNKAAIDKLIKNGLIFDFSRYLKGEDSSREADKNTSSGDFGNANVTVSRNQSKNGIEVRFEGVPSEAQKGYVKSKGFKWSGFSKVWYAPYSEKLLKELNDHFGEKPKPANSALALKIAVAKAKIKIALAIN